MAGKATNVFKLGTCADTGAEVIKGLENELDNILLPPNKMTLFFSLVITWLSRHSLKQIVFFSPFIISGRGLGRHRCLGTRWGWQGGLGVRARDLGPGRLSQDHCVWQACHLQGRLEVIGLGCAPHLRRE